MPQDAPFNDTIKLGYGHIDPGISPSMPDLHKSVIEFTVGQEGATTKWRARTCDLCYGQCTKIHTYLTGSTALIARTGLSASHIYMQQICNRFGYRQLLGGIFHV